MIKYQKGGIMEEKYDFSYPWTHPELFADIDFQDLRVKVDEIRKNQSVYAEKFDQLNKRIDLDYIKDSELIEGNTVPELQGVDINEIAKAVYAGPSYLQGKDPEFRSYKLNKIVPCENENSLIIFQHNENNVNVKVCRMPSHLEAVNFAMKQARFDSLTFKENGFKNPLTPEFIEKIHELLFSSFILLNTRLNRDPNGPPIKPAGYGKFRETIMLNGGEIPHKYNVEVEGATWQASDSDNVVNDMKTIIDFYNKSEYNPIIKAMIFKAQFVKIHPFRDGNGRTSRILFNYMLVRAGIPTITFKGAEKEKYLHAMNDAILDNNYIPLSEIVKKSLKQRCKVYQTLINKYKSISNEKENLK